MQLPAELLGPRDPRIVDSATFRRLARARDLVHAAPDRALTLDDLALAAGLSRFHFLRLFRRAYGATPGAYLTEVRLERARVLLARGTPVTETCLSVGFSSLGSFSAAFTKRHGASPQSYQRHVRRLVGVPERLAQVFVPFCFLERYGA